MTFTDDFFQAMANGENKKISQTILQKQFEKERKKKLKKKFNGVINKYTEPIQNAFIDTAEYNLYRLRYLFIREDFAGWHKLVEGGYKNAHPADLIDNMLKYMQNNGTIPICVKYIFLSRSKCEVEFSWGPVN